MKLDCDKVILTDEKASAVSYKAMKIRLFFFQKVFIVIVEFKTCGSQHLCWIHQVVPLPHTLTWRPVVRIFSVLKTRSPHYD